LHDYAGISQVLSEIFHAPHTRIAGLLLLHFPDINVKLMLFMRLDPNNGNNVTKVICHEAGGQEDCCADCAPYTPVNRAKAGRINSFGCA
jgi:hypothetical protein